MSGRATTPNNSGRWNRETGRRNFRARPGGGFTRFRKAAHNTFRPGKFRCRRNCVVRPERKKIPRRPCLCILPDSGECEKISACICPWSRAIFQDMGNNPRRQGGLPKHIFAEGVFGVSRRPAEARKRRKKHGGRRRAEPPTPITLPSAFNGGRPAMGKLRRGRKICLNAGAEIVLFQQYERNYEC